MLKRRLAFLVSEYLDQFPAVALTGPRQVGKTTLAEAIAGDGRASVYLDLENPADREKLADPVQFLSPLQDKLVVIDEVQKVPELFQPLRGLIDVGRRQGRRSGRFLLLGSASLDLLRQSGESLAGRIGYLELAPLDVLEIEPADREKLWTRGGFPESFLAGDDRASMRWRANFIRSYLERDIPDLAPRIPTEAIRRLWTMLAHLQAKPLNTSQLANSLSVDGKTVTRHLDLLVDLLLVRRLPAYHGNIGKRLVKTPKVVVRDSGIMHALLGIPDREALLGHPGAGASWEAHVIETLIAVAPEGTTAFYYRTSGGAEIDLLLEFTGGRLWAIEIKLGTAPKVERGFHTACDDLKPERRFLVYSGADRYPKPHGIEAIGLRELAQMVSAA